MLLGEKIKLIRVTEKLTQKEFSQVTEIPLISIKNYEQGRREMNFENLMKITTHSQFSKYALWLVTDEFDTKKKAEQIAPPMVDDLAEY